MRRVILITHGEATHNKTGLVGGWYDSDLTDLGRTQAGDVKSELARLGYSKDIARVYSSDLKRCKQTANIVFSGMDVELIFDARLREMSFGSHEGMPQNKHDKLMVPIAPGGNRIEHKICDGAESRGALAARVSQFVEQEIDNLDETVAIVTHGFTASFVVSAFQKIDPANTGFVSYEFVQGKFSILVEDELFKNRTLYSLNQ